MRSWTLRLLSVGLLASLSACDNTLDCKTGETQPCYTGPEGTQGVGLCGAGWRGCASGKWDSSACQGEIIPSEEVCDGLDNDCDGETDEGLLNACGGCRALDAKPGATCGTCSVWTCDGKESLECKGPEETIGGTCTADNGCQGSYRCEGGELLCAAPAKNACELCGGPEITGLGEDCTNTAGCPGKMACAADGTRLVCYGPSKNNCGACGKPDVPGAGATCTADNGCPGTMRCNEEGTAASCQTTLVKNECGLCGGGAITGLNQPCTNEVGCEGITVCNTSGDSTLCNAPGKNNCGACGKPQVLNVGSSCVADNGCTGRKVCGDGGGACEAPARNECGTCGGPAVAELGEQCTHGNGCQGTWQCNAQGNARVCVAPQPFGQACTYSYTDDEGTEQLCASTLYCATENPAEAVCKPKLKNECGVCGGPEILDFGAPCMHANGCQGTWQCNAQGTGRVCVAEQPFGQACIYSYTDDEGTEQSCASTYFCAPENPAEAACKPVVMNECGLCGGPAVAELGETCMHQNGCQGSWQCNEAKNLRVCVAEQPFGQACDYAYTDRNGEEQSCPSAQYCAPEDPTVAVCKPVEKNECGLCGGPAVPDFGEACTSADGCAGEMVCNEEQTAAVCNAPMKNNCRHCLHDDVPGIGEACELPNGCFTIWMCHPSQPGERVCPMIPKNNCDACGAPNLDDKGAACTTGEGCAGTFVCSLDGWSLECKGEVRNACGACSETFEVAELNEPCVLDGCPGVNVCAEDGLGVACNATKNNCDACNAPDVDNLHGECTTDEGCVGVVECDEPGTGSVCRPLEVANACGVCAGPEIFGLNDPCDFEECPGVNVCAGDGLSVVCNATKNNCGACNVPDVGNLHGDCTTDEGCGGLVACDEPGTGSVCTPLEVANACLVCGGPEILGLNEPCEAEGCPGVKVCAEDGLSAVCDARRNNCDVCGQDVEGVGEPCADGDGCTGAGACSADGLSLVCNAPGLNNCNVCNEPNVSGIGETCSNEGCEGHLQCSADGLSAVCDAFRNNCLECNAPDVEEIGDACSNDSVCFGNLVCAADGLSAECDAQLANNCRACGAEDVEGLDEPCDADGCPGTTVCAEDGLSTACQPQLNNCGDCSAEDVPLIDEDCTDPTSGCPGTYVCSEDKQSAVCEAPETCDVGHVVISEIATKGPGGPDDEFVELYNPTPSAVDLSGWSLQYRSATGSSFSVFKALPAGTTIAAHGYLLVGHNSYDDTAVAADVNYSSGLSGNGGTVALVSSSTALLDLAHPTLIDMVGYGTGATFEGETGPAAIHATDGSMERKANAASDAASMETGADALAGNGHDTDDNAADFVVRATRDPQNAASAPEP